jgi:hypothetical protein
MMDGFEPEGARVPFTISHSAAAIPLQRALGRRAVLSALVIGCMVPDLPYFLPRHAFEGRTHSLPSVIWFAVPTGLAIYFLWERWLREPILFLLPHKVRCRLAGRPAVPRPGLALIVTCLAAGALSHIAWDACTHRDGALVRAWPPMRALLWQAWDYRVRTYKLLQHASTVVGGAVILAWARRSLNKLPELELEPPAPLAARVRYLVWAAIAAAPAVAVAFGLEEANPLHSAHALEAFLTPAAVAGVIAVVVPLLAFALAWHVRARATRPPPR